MSAILKGLLQPQIVSVITQLESVNATDPASVAAARARLADKLSTAIALAVQQYLLTSVRVSPAGTILAP